MHYKFWRQVIVKTLVCELMLEEKAICNVKLELLPENLLLKLFCLLLTFETASEMKLLSALCCIKAPFFFPILRINCVNIKKKKQTHLIPPKRTTSTKKAQTQPTKQVPCHMKTGLLSPLCLIILIALCQTSLAASHYGDSSWSGTRLGGSSVPETPPGFPHLYSSVFPTASGCQPPWKT